MTVTLVTVVIPARNEAESIAGALESVLAQTYPLSSIEIVVVDGMSTDDTPQVVKSVLDGGPVRRWTVLLNPEATTPTNLNMGLDWAEGQVIVRVDARSALPSDYIERTVGVLDDPRIAVVGGRQAARPRRAGLVCRSIARALNNPFANGGAIYRNHRAKSGKSDTAYLGVFRTDQLRSVNGWAPRFTSNQDFELSRRMNRLGDVWYEAGLPVGYEPRSTFGGLFRQYRRFGRWKAIYWATTGDRPQPRQLILLAVPGLAFTGATVVLATTPVVAVRLALAGLGALLVVDHVGEEESGGFGERLGSCAAMTLIGFGWWSGAVQQAFSKGSRHER